MKIKRALFLLLIMAVFVSITSLSLAQQNPNQARLTFLAQVARTLQDLKSLLISLSNRLAQITPPAPTLGPRIIARPATPKPVDPSDPASLEQRDFEPFDPSKSQIAYQSGTIVVKFKPGGNPDAPGLNNLKNQYGFRGARRLAKAGHSTFGTVYAIDIAHEKEPLDAVIDFSKNPLVERAEPNFVFTTTQVTPNDPLYSLEWHLPNISAPQAWTVTQGTPSTVVAVIDTGVRWYHPDLVGNIWSNAGEIPGNGIDDEGNGFIDDVRGWDFANPPLGTVCFGNAQIAPDCDGPDNNPDDDFFHGTHIAGTIAELMNNSLGGTGICPGCKIMPVKISYSIFNPFASNLPAAILTLDAIIQSIVYATDNGADILSMSFGTKANPTLLALAITYASNQGRVLVAGAGNFNNDSKFYPAAYGDVIAVAATTETNQRAYFSNFGSWVDIAAPGVNIWATFIPGINYSSGTAVTCGDPDGDGYGPCQGTSMATPVISAAAALALSKNPALTSTQVKTLILSSYDNVIAATSTLYVGPGRINVNKVVTPNSVPTALFANSMEDAYFGATAGAISGTASGQNFQKYKVEYGAGVYPQSWSIIQGDTFTPVTSGTLATWNPATAAIPSGRYTLKLTVTNTSGDTFEHRVLVWIDTSLAPGWPKFVSGPVWSSRTSPAIINIDGDLDREAFFEVGDPISAIVDTYHGMDHNALGLAGFPIQQSGFWGYKFSPVVGDVDGDGLKEVVYCSSTSHAYTLGTTECRLYTTSGALKPGWPVTLPGEAILSSNIPVAFANMDSDNDLEIIISTFNREGGNCVTAYNRIYVFNPNGQPVSGWPKTFQCRIEGISLGDVDANGDMEIAVATAYDPALVNPYDPTTWNGKLYLFNHDGTTLSGWPQQIVGYYPPTLADVDQNDGGKLEIIQSSADAKLHLRNHNGTSVQGWPISVNYAFQEIAVGDLDGNGDMEIAARYPFSTGQSTVLVYNHNGTVLSGWPVFILDTVTAYFGSTIFLSESAPIMVDLDADGSRELIFGLTQSRSLHAYRANGTIFPGFPKTLGDQFRFVTASDFNGNNLADLFVVDYSGRMYLWEFGPVTTTSFLWPGWRHDNERTGRATPGTPTASPSPSPSASPSPPPTVPGAPGTLSGVAISSSAVNLSWGAASGAMSYQVQVATNNSFNPNSIVPGWNNVNVGNVVNFTVGGLQPNTTYRFRVRGINSAGVGPYSNKTAVQTLP